MHELLTRQRAAVAVLCRRHGVARLEVFGSAARSRDFDPDHSDVDFLVEFPAPALDWQPFLDLRDDLEHLLGRRVDLVDRVAVEAGRNSIRRRKILAEAELLYAA